MQLMLVQTGEIIWSGKGALRNNDSTREEILTRYFPQYRLIAPQAHSGLGGASCIIEQGERRLVLRQNHDPSAPASHFRRQFRALRRLPADLVPTLVFSDRAGWPWTIWKVKLKASCRTRLSLRRCCIICTGSHDWGGERRYSLYWNITGSKPCQTDVLQCGWHVLSGCVKRASRSRFGSRRCIWMFMPGILFIRQRASAYRLGICGRWRCGAGAGGSLDRE